ncbi:MAG: nitroreductase family protein [Prevotella sp.]|nr:nitroreductase family protein [Prevotella sp.]
MENEVLKAIRERRSIRRYKAEQITDNELKTVLEAGTWAATGHGTQDPWIVAVQKEDVLIQLRAMNAKEMGITGDPYYGAPTIVLVFASAGNYNKERDGSLVLGNMMLAAHSIGLASCWINREDAMFQTNEGKRLMSSFGLPEGLVGIGALALGYASAHPHTVKSRKENYYRIIK